MKALRISYKVTDLQDDVITVRKKWKNLSSNLEVKKGAGCHFGCLYCNQISLDINKITNEKTSGYIFLGVDSGISINSKINCNSEIQKIVSIEDIVTDLLKYPFYSQESSLLIENFNDPGLNWERTISWEKNGIYF